MDWAAAFLGNHVCQMMSDVQGSTGAMPKRIDLSSNVASLGLLRAVSISNLVVNTLLLFVITQVLKLRSVQLNRMYKCSKTKDPSKDKHWSKIYFSHIIMVGGGNND